MDIQTYQTFIAILIGFQRCSLDEHRRGLIGSDLFDWSESHKAAHISCDIFFFSGEVNAGGLPECYFRAAWGSSIPIVVVVVVVIGRCGIGLARANAAVRFVSVGLRRADYAMVTWLQSANIKEKTLQI